MITVAFDNSEEIIREYPRCLHWPWPRCIHFDISNDALQDPTSIHAYPWGAQVRRFSGFSCAIILHPGGAKAVLL
jgi:hypothetical protein